MESMYLLIPVSLVLVLAIGGLLAWSVLGGQFDDLEGEGERILDDDAGTPPASGARAGADATVAEPSSSRHGPRDNASVRR